jgi:tripartite-type tricarboxylate transporter receptor subunit TctC
VIDHRNPRRGFLQLAVGAAVLPVFTRLAKAQAYPTRPVHLMVGFAAGGVVDVTARVIGQWLSERLGQQFVIENRTGAASNIATELVTRAPAEGYALLMANSANAINASLYNRLSFDFIRDTTPVASVADTSFVMVVNPSFAHKSVPELIAYAKANPGKLAMASAGSGSPPHLVGELFAMMAGVKMLHVPYRGGTPAIADLIGGQVHVYFASMGGGSIEHIRAGKVHPLAVTSMMREDALPKIPVMADFLPGYEATSWLGVVAPKNTPTDIIETLHKEINVGLVDPKMKARFAEQGLTVLSGSRANFEEIIAKDTEKWAKVVKFGGLKAE